MGQMTLHDSPRGFAGLYELMEGDALKVSLVARTFYHSVVMDIERMQQAADNDNWHDVRGLARRISISCDQVSEHRGEQAMASLSRLLDARAMRREYNRFRADIVELSQWAASSSAEYRVALGAHLPARW
jgi:hypothetical protein